MKSGQVVRQKVDRLFPSSNASEIVGMFPIFLVLTNPRAKHQGKLRAWNCREREGRGFIFLYNLHTCNKFMISFVSYIAVSKLRSISICKIKCLINGTLFQVLTNIIITKQVSLS